MIKKILFVLLCSTAFCVRTNAQATSQKVAFNNTLKSYFDVKNALATDNVAKSNSAAKELLTSLKSFPSAKLPTAQLSVWKAELTQLNKFVAPMTVGKEVKAQRKNFEYVSLAMIKLAKALPLSSNEIYVQYCPMVKRSWLNEVEDIQNPFYGSMMYDCGEVTDTIVKK